MQHFNSDAVSVQSAHFIGGQYSAGRMAMDVRRPSDNRVYAGLPVADAEMVDRAVQNAWTAFKTRNWARQAPRERARVLRRWADLIESDVRTLAPMEAIGSTRPIRDAQRRDVPFCAEGIRFFAELADKLGGEVAATPATPWA